MSLNVVRKYQLYVKQENRETNLKVFGLAWYTESNRSVPYN